MKTITIKTYKFLELDEKIRNEIIEVKRDSEDLDWLDAEYSETLKAFSDVFNIDINHFSFLDFCYNDYSFNIDENILNLSGFRLAKYIWNNYKQQIYKGRYYSLWSKREKSFKYHKDGFPVLKTRYSKIFLDNDCVLTGMCCDHKILDPIYKFMENPCLNMSFSDLLEQCLESFTNDYKLTYEYQMNEGIEESIIDEGLDYLKDGTEIN